MIEGISHLTFVVKDLEKASNLFIEIFQANEVYNSGEDTFSLSKEKFFLIGEVWIAIMEGDSLKERTYNHTAFKVSSEDFPQYVKRIEALGLETLNGRKRIDGEADSIYFYDYDNHLFEIHSGTLEERLQSYTTNENLNK